MRSGTVCAAAADGAAVLLRLALEQIGLVSSDLVFDGNMLPLRGK